MPLRRLLLRGLSCDPVGFAIFAILGGRTFAIFFEFSERIFSRLRRTLTGLPVRLRRQVAVPASNPPPLRAEPAILMRIRPEPNLDPFKRGFKHRGQKGFESALSSGQCL
jgi:hypothetical protein